MSMISLMAAVMAVQAGLVRQVQYGTSIKHTAGAAAAAMLFSFEGAFTVGFQATVWVYPYVMPAGAPSQSLFHLLLLREL